MAKSPKIEILVDTTLAVLNAGDVRKSFDGLCTLWAETHHEALASMVATIAEKSPTTTTIDGKSMKARLVAWIEVARRDDPQDLSLLLRFVESADEMRHVYLVAPRLEELTKRSVDPRLGLFAMSILQDPAVEPGNAARKIWTRCGKLLVGCADPRTIEPARALLADVETRVGTRVGQYGVEAPDTHFQWVTERLPGVLAKIEKSLKKTEKARTVLDSRLSEIRAAVESFAPRDSSTGAEGEGQRTTEELFDEVYEDLGNDELRAVLADYLTEAGDPRGEFIALQLRSVSGKAPAKALRREKALERKHGGRWIGPLKGIVKVKSLSFERGFAVSGEVKPLKVYQMEAEAGHREWSTFERIRFEGGRAYANASCSIISPQMRSAKILEGVCHRGLLTLSEMSDPIPVERITTHLGWGAFDEAGANENGLYELVHRDGLTTLRHLGLYTINDDLQGPKAYAWLWKSPIAETLTSLEVTCFYPELIALWMKTAEDLPIEEIVLNTGYEPWFLPSRWVFFYSRGEGGRFSNLVARCEHFEKGSIFSALELLAHIEKGKISSLRFEIGCVNPKLRGQAHSEIQKALAGRYSSLDVIDTASS